jgi:hypothetical protein
MKKIILLLILVLLFQSSLNAWEILTNDFSGVITFKNGEKAEYTWLNFETIKYARSLNDLKHGTSNLITINLNAIQQIEFIPITDEEIKIQKELEISGRKVNIILNDKSRRDKVYLGLYTDFKWKNKYEIGYFDDPDIISMTVSYKKSDSKKVNEEEIKSSNFSGIITFYDGQKINFNNLWSSYTGTELEYSTTLIGMKFKPFQLRRRRINLISVKEIDFLPFSAEEIQIRKASENLTSGMAETRKANIIYNDDYRKDKIFINCYVWEWKNQNESGELLNSNIASMNISYKNSK